jgi:hypothetical protein
MKLTQINEHSPIKLTKLLLYLLLSIMILPGNSV